MPIKVACQCGQQFAAKDELAGKRVKCPKCAAVLTIPQPRANQAGTAKGVSELMDDAGMRSGIERCPGCGIELDKSAVLCVMCGFDTRLGHRLKTRIGSAVVIDEEELGDLPTHGNAVLDAAERQLARDKLEQKRLSKGAPWWMLLLAFLGLVGFAVAMVSMPQDQVMDNSGTALQVAGVLIFLMYFVRMLIIAFKEAVLQGVLALVMPPYYVITRWDRVAGVCILMFVGVGLALAGFALIWLAPYINKPDSDKKKASLIRLERGPTIVLVCRDTAMI